MDERKESGEFYPGGRAPQGGGGSGGEGGDTAPKVPVTHVDELPERYREGEMRAKINEIARIVSGGVAALAAMVATAQVTVQGARKDALWNEDFVVTNVTVDIGHLATTNQLVAAAGAAERAAEGKLAAATNDLAGTMGGVIVSATNNLAEAVGQNIAAATNAAAADRDAKLEGYATKTWVQGQGYADGSALEGYATQGWVTEQGYAPKSWVESRGYMTGTNLAPYATKDWVEGRGYVTGTNLTPYALKDWVEGKGYVTGDEAREGIEKGAEEAVRRIAAEMDGTTAHRLMVPGAWEWIDGTGAIWRVYSTVEWHGVTLTGDMGARNWIGQGWSIGWEPGDENAEIGTWRMRNELSAAGPLEVEWIGEELPYGEGKWRLLADKVELNGVMVTPGQITENGWYQIADENYSLHFVSPLVTTVTVARVTNAVDRLARLEELSPPTSLAPATNYTDEAVGELKRELEDGEVYVENSEISHIADIAYRLENNSGVDNRTADEIFAQLDAASHITTNDVCNIVTNEVPWWTFSPPSIMIDGELQQIYAELDDFTDSWFVFGGGAEYPLGANLYPGESRVFQAASDNGGIEITATWSPRNALGLARLTDISRTVSNTVTKAYVEGLGIESGIQIEEDPHWEAAKGGYATTGTVAQVSEAVGTLWSYVYGDSVWIAVTNYMRTIGGVSPSFQLWEVRNGATNLVYWSKEEITNVTHDLIHDCKTNLEQTVRNAVAEMPDKAWSKYQSATGNEAPDGVTIVSTPTIQLTGGGEWYRYVDVSSNSVWFLKSNGLHTIGGDTNGYFRILDDEGHTTFEVKKTDSYLVDAVPSSVCFDEDGNFCVSFQSNVKPVIYTSASLSAPNFLQEGDDPNVTVTWTQFWGTYTATLEQAVKGPSLFAYAKVEMPGETVIRNSVPTDMQGGIVVNGVKYNVGTATINGNTVLTLTPRN